MVQIVPYETRGSGKSGIITNSQDDTVAYLGEVWTRFAFTVHTLQYIKYFIAYC